MKAPHRLYKYRPLNEFTKDIICNNRIWFSRPAALNDPFDCQVNVRFEADEHQLRQYAREVLGSDIPHVEGLVDLLVEQSQEHYFDLMRSLYETNRTKVADHSSLLCLSAKCDDILMFAHYADCQRGCVLGFEVQWEDEIGKVFPVTYTRSYPELDYFKMRDDGFQLMKSLLLSKFEAWKYEAEYRVLRYDIPEGLVSFREEALTSIILGCQMSADSKDEIRQWNSTRAVPCRLYQAQVNSNHYKIDIKQID